MNTQRIFVWQSDSEPPDFDWYYARDAAERRRERAGGSVREIAVPYALTSGEIESAVHYEVVVRPLEEAES